MSMNPYKRSVYYYETDQMAIAHHSNYIRWMEEARLDAMAQMGLDYAKMEELGILIPVTDVQVRYIRPLRYGDTFFVDVTITVYNGVRLVCSYDIFKKGDTLPCATGTSAHCFLDKRTYKPIYFQKRFPELSAIFAGHVAGLEDGEQKQ